VYVRLSHVTLLCIRNQCYCEFTSFRSILNCPWLSAWENIIWTVCCCSRLLLPCLCSDHSACWCRMQWKAITEPEVACESYTTNCALDTAMLLRRHISSIITVGCWQHLDIFVLGNLGETKHLHLFFFRCIIWRISRCNSSSFLAETISYLVQVHEKTICLILLQDVLKYRCPDLLLYPWQYLHWRAVT